MYNVFKEYRLQQPFFSLIELATKPFLPQKKRNLSTKYQIFGACFIIAAILTTSILILQNYVPYFKSYWTQWYYIDDFHLSQIYTTQNGTSIDYNNQTLLNRTIFNYANNEVKQIKMYDFFEIVIELNTDETLDEMNLTLQFVAINQSTVTEELGITATAEFYTRDIFYNGEWFKLQLLHTNYNLSNNGEFVEIVFQPETNACNFWSGTQCYISNKYRIRIRNGTNPNRYM